MAKHHGNCSNVFFRVKEAVRCYVYLADSSGMWEHSADLSPVLFL